MNIMPSHPRQRSGIPLLTPIGLGMLMAQVIAAGFVYLSNQRIHSMVTAMDAAGYFAMPTGPVTATLNSFGAAFWGGLFFSLSIGVGLALAAWAAIQLWILLFHRNRPALAIYAILWAAMVVFVNLHGFALFPTLFCLLVPLTTAGVTVKMMPPSGNSRPFYWLVPVMTLIVLTALWATQLNQNLFTTIRDHILLSNPVGRTVNDFYYRYTLYAAEAFKSFEQKSLRSCRLEGIDDRSAHQWEVRLAALDMPVLPQISHPDIRMVFSEKKLRMISPSGRYFETAAADFLANPRQGIRSYSLATDRFGPLRRMTLAGLLLGFPVLLFVIVYGVLRLAAGLVVHPKQATLSASGICLIIGILLFIPMLSARPIAITPETIQAALDADQWPQRVAALRYIDMHKLEIAVYPAYQRLLTSPLVVERYWLARAMASSRSDETYNHLLSFMRDPHPNVICQAFYALGERGRRTAIDPIKRQLVLSDHWYAQWYGYGALRKLGWRQTKSN